jgi:hypothetical protein
MDRVFLPEVEVLEPRCVLATVAPAATTIAAATILPNPAVPGSAAPALQTSLKPPLGAPAFPATASSLPAALPSPVPGLPVGAGAVPLDNSIPNGAAVLSGQGGFTSQSPFLPTYNLNYTQTGPFYTGSGSGATQQQAISLSTAEEAATMLPAFESLGAPLV